MRRRGGKKSEREQVIEGARAEGKGNRGREKREGRGGGARGKARLSCLNKNEAGCGEITLSLFLSLSLSPPLYPAVLFLLLMPTTSPYHSLCSQSAFPLSPLTRQFKGKRVERSFYSQMRYFSKNIFNLHLLYLQV